MQSSKEYGYLIQGITPKEAYERLPKPQDGSLLNIEGRQYSVEWDVEPPLVFISFGPAPEDGSLPNYVLKAKVHPELMLQGPPQGPVWGIALHKLVVTMFPGYKLDFVWSLFETRR